MSLQFLLFSVQSRLVRELPPPTQGSVIIRAQTPQIHSDCRPIPVLYHGPIPLPEAPILIARHVPVPGPPYLLIAVTGQRNIEVTAISTRKFDMKN